MSFMSLAREEEFTKICGVCGVETDELENDCCSRCNEDNSSMPQEDQVECESCGIETNNLRLGECAQCHQDFWSD